MQGNVAVSWVDVLPPHPGRLKEVGIGVDEQGHCASLPNPWIRGFERSGRSLPLRTVRSKSAKHSGLQSDMRQDVGGDRTVVISYDDTIPAKAYVGCLSRLCRARS
jgi:hypothetical protein